jgi:hypothetical protein
VVLDAQVVEEKAIFIHPEFRSAKGGRAKRLCEFSKKASDDLGIPLDHWRTIQQPHRSQSSHVLKAPVWQSQSGAFFLYGAKTGEFQRMEQ